MVSVGVGIVAIFCKDTIKNDQTTPPAPRLIPFYALIRGRGVGAE